MTAPTWMINELSTLTTDIGRGEKSKRVKVIQEWLNFHNIHCNIDEDFGGVTEKGVKDFQSAKSLPVTGVVDAATYTALTAPMIAALTPPTLNPGATLSQAILAVGARHYEQKPRELGGANRGPWVRLYMRGAEGDDQLWCAGFACFIQESAAALLGSKAPLKNTFSCDNIAKQAKSAGKFVSGTAGIGCTPGSLFLVRSKDNPLDWIHVGIVINAGPELVETLEGNTDHQGSSNGYEVAQRTRGYGRLDFYTI